MVDRRRRVEDDPGRDDGGRAVHPRRSHRPKLPSRGPHSVPPRGTTPGGRTLRRLPEPSPSLMASQRRTTRAGQPSYIGLGPEFVSNLLSLSNPCFTLRSGGIKKAAGFAIRRPAHETWAVMIKSWIKRPPRGVGCVAARRRNGRDESSLLLGESDHALFLHWYLSTSTVQDWSNANDPSRHLIGIVYHRDRLAPSTPDE